MAKISVIIPVHNEKNFIRRCIESVVACDEVIIVDDGSTDGSVDIANEYALRYDNIMLVRFLDNRGVSEARNTGLEKTTGDYVAFLDADDELLGGAIQAMRSAAELGENIVQFNHWRCPPAGSSARPRFETIAKWYTAHARPQWWQLAWNKLYKREFLNANRLRFLKGLQFGEDEIFNLEAILANGGIRQLRSATVVKHFENQNSLCHQLDLHRFISLLNALTMLAEAYEESEMTEQGTEVRFRIREHLESDLYKRLTARENENENEQA